MIGRYALRTAVLAYLGLLLGAPAGYVFWKTFEHGLSPAWHAVTAPDAVHALNVTLVLAAIAVPANTIFGVLAALAIVRHRFPGAGLFNAVVDLPLALSPVVVGLALLLLYGREGWLGGHGVAFALPGMVLATIFVSLPFVVREVVPVLREIGTVSVVSGRLTGETESMTLYVQDRYRSFDEVGAYASSVVLAVLGVLTLILMTRLKP